MSLWPDGKLIGALSTHQKVVGLITSQGTYLGCRFHPRSGCILEATDISSPTIPPPQKTIKHILG